MTDIVSERAALFLGSRLKRLAERMQSQVTRLVEKADLPLQPSHMPVLGTLDRDGPQTIGALTEAMQVAQPTVTRAVARLTELGLVETNREHRDQRHKTIRLTPAGREALDRAKMLVWNRAEAAVEEVLADLDPSFLDQLTRLEALLAQEPLDVRAARRLEAGVSVVEFTDALAPAFRTINMEWLEDMYAVEPVDLKVLDHPRTAIIEAGGAILFAVVDGVGPVGTCALKPSGGGAIELTKMGVLKSARGAKIGEALLAAAIARAQAMGAAPLYLLSNRKSAAAIHLYEKLGFVHDATIMARYGAAYERCDVAMAYRG
ncbi:MarR family transcriptional regulator [Caulobacter flavus]|uniref:MarR family transcriptional regulator n=1 Tax=Caulobacter flavus TaxID=1679497 RepID=A0A2N5CS05_9CAUL|nr:bifunctional helix-turn-helix transcriptional regulator/GNAT family N-acetyltransferase [Caulobacter flavus]AYV46461.1 MarR family transcriptional regulator [Caulobacter flavus]PLR12758.1 MarR family transcriptional regulator [Caulobacter flavus]